MIFLASFKTVTSRDVKDKLCFYISWYFYIAGYVLRVRELFRKQITFSVETKPREKQKIETRLQLQTISEGVRE